MSEMKVDQGGGRESTARVNYPSNSKQGQKRESERAKPEKVVEGEVVQRKKSTAGRFLSKFISDDSQGVGEYVIMEVLLPAAKNMVSDAVSQGIERLLFGDAKPSRSGHRAYTNYSRNATGQRYIPGSPMSDPRPPLSRQARASHDFDDIIIASRAEAEEVLDRLRDLINQYEVATVSDLYDLVGLTGEFTDDKWGWDDLRSASIRAIRGGYLLNLPRTHPIT
ncbi:MAG TPA: hypothetical protein VGI71_24030 [Scandinavium sp.]|jgi:hypothetical protein